MMPLGLLAASRKYVKPDIEWTPEGLPVGALLKDYPQQWRTAYITATNFVVMEEGGEKYVYHNEGSNLATRIYSAMYLPSWTADTDATVDVMGSTITTLGLGFRRSDTKYDENGGYMALISGSSFILQSQSALSSRSTLASVSLPHTAASERWSIRVRAVGSELSAKAWRTADPEPPGWMVTATDSTYPEGAVGFVGAGRGSAHWRRFYRLQSRGEVGD